MITEKFVNCSRVTTATGEFLEETANLPDRRQSKPSQQYPTIAQCIRRSSDPYRASIASFSRRDCPHGQNKQTFYFEDGSFLTFAVTYTAIEDGGR